MRRFHTPSRVLYFPKTGRTAEIAIAPLSTRANKLMLRDEKQSLKNPWNPVQDPKGSGLVYYWNKETNETTALGAPRPQHWVEVNDPNGSDKTYWWNPDTNQTTPLGASKPGANTSLVNVPESSNAQVQPYQAFQQMQQPMTLGKSMRMYFVLGFGMTLGMIAVRVLLG